MEGGSSGVSGLSRSNPPFKAKSGGSASLTLLTHPTSGRTLTWATTEIMSDDFVLDSRSLACDEAPARRIMCH